MENESPGQESIKAENLWQKFNRERGEKKMLSEQKQIWIGKHPRASAKDYNFDLASGIDKKKHLRATKEGFDPINYLNNMTEPMIEIGGPTENKYQLVDWNQLNRKVIVSDIVPVEGNSMVASATSLPFADNSLSAVFASALDSEHTRYAAIDEGYRVLKPGGLLILQGFDVQGGQALGEAIYKKDMEIMQTQQLATPDYYIILQKPMDEIKVS